MSWPGKPASGARMVQCRPRTSGPRPASSWPSSCHAKPLMVRNFSRPWPDAMRRAWVGHDDPRGQGHLLPPRRRYRDAPAEAAMTTRRIHHALAVVRSCLAPRSKRPSLPQVWSGASQSPLASWSRGEGPCRRREIMRLCSRRARPPDTSPRPTRSGLDPSLSPSICRYRGEGSRDEEPRRRPSASRSPSAAVNVGKLIGTELSSTDGSRDIIPGRKRFGSSK